MMTGRGAIVFDLDGTLVDSLPDLAAAANAMLAEAGSPELSLIKIKGFIGHGIPNLVGRIMAELSIPAARQAELQASMLRHYLAHPADRSRPYPGVALALQRLREAGHSLGICTNKMRAPAMAILQTLELAPFFDVVIGGDCLPQRKPDPAPLHAAFAQLPGQPLLFVGDSEVDAETAVAATIPFALFTEGYRKQPVEKLPHDFAFGHYDDFASGLGRLRSDS